MMTNYKLDKEEQEILEAFDSGEMQAIPNAKEEIKNHQEYASNTFKEDKSISMN
jgi:hypothetical protein